MFLDNIEELAEENTNFRKVVHTGTHCQTVIMSIPEGEDIGEETHPNTDQILLVVEGQAEIIIDGEIKKLQDQGVAFVPAGAKHNVKNTGHEDLKLFTVYAPPEHPEGTVHETKEKAIESER